MRKWGVFLIFLWGAICLAPLSSHAAILVINMQDPKTVSSFTKLSASEQESALAAMGDVISVMGDDWTLDDQRFGTKECANNPPADGGGLACVEVRGLSSEEARDLAMPIIRTTMSDDLVLVRYRRFQLSWEALPEGIRYDLFHNGAASLDLTDWKEYVIDKEVVR